MMITKADSKNEEVQGLDNRKEDNSSEISQAGQKKRLLNLISEAIVEVIINQSISENIDGAIDKDQH